MISTFKKDTNQMESSTPEFAVRVCAKSASVAPKNRSNTTATIKLKNKNRKQQRYILTLTLELLIMNNLMKLPTPKELQRKSRKQQNFLIKKVTKN